MIFVLAGLAFGFAGLTASPTTAGPFNELDGVWGGSGVVTYASGTSERLSCRVQYFLANDDNLQQALKCASDSYNFHINAMFLNDDGVISGRWEETVLELNGTVSGSATGGRIEGTLHGTGFEADMVVTTAGNRQQVKIITPDQEIRQVDIEVRRARL